VNTRLWSRVFVFLGWDTSRGIAEIAVIAVIGKPT